MKKIRELETELAGLLEQRPRLPTRAPLETVGNRDVMKLEEGAIVDRVKLTAYNAEEWLLEQLAPHYQNTDDIRQLLRSFAELSGEIRTTAQGVAITLDPPDTPRTAELYAASAPTSASSTPPTWGPISPLPTRWHCTVRNAPLDRSCPVLWAALRNHWLRCWGPTEWSNRRRR